MIKPFADDQNTMSIADLNVENGTAAVVITGSLEVTRDKVGLKHAQALKAMADSMVEQLEAAEDLPDKIAPAQAPAADSVKNPFG